MATSTLGSGTLVLAGTTSGTTTVTATAVAGTTTLTLPAATDTLVGKATTDTLTNKTLTSPTLITPALGTPSALVLTNATGLPQSGLGANVAGNGPAFSAYMGSGQALSAVTNTKLQYNTENFDTNSNYDNSTNYRFTPTVAGYYQINACFTGASSTSGDFLISISKNGTGVAVNGFNSSVTGGFTNSPSVSALIQFDGSTDYVEVFAYVQNAQTLQSGVSRVFSGVLVRTA